jgi:hypothetical protein
MRKRLLWVVFSVITILALTVSPVGAVTDGELDGDAHPYVVLLLMEVGGVPMYRCSGTLLSPTVLLTAGHCTSNYPDPEPYSGMRVFTESDVQNGDNNYPYAGPNSVEAVAWYTHPLFETAPFFMHDVGVVILAEPGVVLDTYGTLPEPNQFDSFKTRRGQDKVTFTSVGYGLQQSFPDPAYWLAHNTRTRYVAHPRLIQINVPGFTGSYSMLLSNNANTGGTCFGDSGGPNFLGDTTIVAGITSFGINGNCAGTGGVFRTDRQDVLDFIYSHFTP